MSASGFIAKLFSLSGAGNSMSSDDDNDRLPKITFGSFSQSSCKKEGEPSTRANQSPPSRMAKRRVVAKVDLKMVEMEDRTPSMKDNYNSRMVSVQFDATVPLGHERCVETPSTML